MHHLFSRLSLWLDPVGRDGPDQMACDEALLGEADGPVLRVFRWRRPWVTAGFFVPWEEAKQSRPDLPRCRRWTGGGVVVHDGDFTFSLVAPRGEPWAGLRPAESYEVLHQGVRFVLSLSHPQASLASASTGTGRDCFTAPVPHDVLVAGRKAVGGAQRRTKRGLLHQGSVQGVRLDADFPQRLATALGREVAVWTPPAGFETAAAELTQQKYATPEFLQRPVL